MIKRIGFVVAVVFLLLPSGLAQNEPTQEDDLDSIREKAEQGDAFYQWLLAYKYQDGEGVTQNYPEAVKWYRKAAQQEDVT